MKRAREDGPSPGEDKNISGPDRHAPNQFGEWLLENIYKYARVRDSDKLAEVTRKYNDLSKRFAELLQYVRMGGHHDDYNDFCVGCGRTDITERRETCSACDDAFVSCSRCGVDKCDSGRHVICLMCKRLRRECNGRHPDTCTF